MKPNHSLTLILSDIYRGVIVIHLDIRTANERRNQTTNEAHYGTYGTNATDPYRRIAKPPQKIAE